MGRRSSIEKLSPAIRNAVAALIEYGLTIDEIVSDTCDLGGKVSRSSVFRYRTKYRRIAADLRRSRDIAESLVEEIGEDAVGDVMLMSWLLDEILAQIALEKRGK